MTYQEIDEILDGMNHGDAYYSDDSASWLNELKEVMQQRDRLLAALHRITEIRRGCDGDCGAAAIANEAIFKVEEEQKR